MCDDTLSSSATGRVLTVMKLPLDYLGAGFLPMTGTTISLVSQTVWFGAVEKIWAISPSSQLYIQSLVVAINYFVVAAQYSTRACTNYFLDR